MKSATEEERLGLVKGDSHALPRLPDYPTEDEDYGGQGETDVDVDVDEGSSGIDWGGVGGRAPRPVTGFVEEREREGEREGRNVLLLRERDGGGRGGGSGFGRGGGEGAFI